MTLAAHEEWRKTILADCLRSRTCVPQNMQYAYCRHGGATSRVCDYHTCPRRRYYKTDGGCVVTTRGNEIELIFYHIPMTLTLSPDRVRFLARALGELSEKLDAEKAEVLA